MNPPDNLEVLIAAVKQEKDDKKRNILVDVGIIGTDNVKFKNGVALFSGIKFYSTSYSHQSSKF